MPLPVSALQELAAAANEAIVAIVFAILWRQYRRPYLLAFGLSFAGIAANIAQIAIELSIGQPLAWRPLVSDALFIGAALLLLGGCMARVHRRVPTRAFATFGIVAFVAVQLIAATLGIEGVVYVPEWGAFVYLAIAYLFWSRPDQSGNRILACLFAARGAVNLPWILALPNGFAPYVHSADQVIIVGIGWALVMTELSQALRQNARLVRDLTEREGRIRRLVDANIIGIFIWSLEGGIIEANDAFLRIVGYERGDLVAGRLSWRALTPPESLARDDQEWVPELRQTGTTPVFEKEYFRKDGSRVPVMIGVASFEIGADEGVAFVLDLTERKRAEEALHQVQMQLAHSNRVAAVGQLTASIAHELRQPLTAAVINGEAGLRWLAIQPPELDQVKYSLEEAIKSAVRGSDIINSLMDLTKKQALRKASVDINEAVQEVTVLIQGEAVKHGVSLRAQLAPRLAHIQGDRLQIQQVVLNLAVNAIQAMSVNDSGRRELQIISESIGSEGVCVGVRDTGPGLSAESIPHLFEPFYTTKPGGIGIGLAICQSIIEAHGGRLWATACEPHGALFQFTIPARQEWLS
ncbi:sensor histidine kinase [Bradyrhizobium sp.]|uniref:sensor histidine kinase n=1 Tax=Bradyrhizobium sp. TaxID=376 RepID=UPI002BB0E93E|nr:ATP-binding protein [Bradyrhizobium sp.]HWX57216.1 ATP-binding protein [Bradyrhizobium sp.]